MINKSFKQGFSIIEFTVVMAVVAILIALIMEGKKAVSQARLNAARSLTKLSPVQDVENLALWLETTSNKSFNKAERIDGNIVTTWYDINKQTTSKNNLSSTSGTEPTYIQNAINGLPALRFDGNDDYLKVTSNDFRIYEASSFSIFVVATYKGGNGGGNDGWNALIATRNGANGMIWFESNAASGDDLESWYRITTGWARVNFNNTQPNLTANIPFIAGEVTTIGGSKELSLTGNNDVSTSLGSSVLNNSSGDFYVGSHTDGSHEGNFDVGEVIFYNRALEDYEREDIEEYLSKKWKIDLN